MDNEIKKGNTKNHLTLLMHTNLSLKRLDDKCRS